MDPMTASAAISFGANLLGGLMGQESSNKANQANERNAIRNIKLQKEFAQQGIRWKVEDAKAAGIHPLYALGANTSSFSPLGNTSSPDYSMANAVSSMGQDVSRAMLAGSTKEERLFNTAMKAEALKSAQLQNKILESQLIGSNHAVNPALPNPHNAGIVEGQGDVPYETKKSQITASAPGVPAREAGVINDVSYIRTHGGIAVAPSKDVKERIEDSLLQELNWAARNQLLPALKGLPAPSTKEVPFTPEEKRRGADHWKWSPLHQQFRPAYRDGKFLPQ